jgi:hypothetical protein
MIGIRYVIPVLIVASQLLTSAYNPKIVIQVPKPSTVPHSTRWGIYELDPASQGFLIALLGGLIVSIAILGRRSSLILLTISVGPTLSAQFATDRLISGLPRGYKNDKYAC